MSLTKDFLEPPGGNFPIKAADIVSASISPAAAVIDEDIFAVSVAVDGYPSAVLTYQWRFEGADLPDETNSTFQPTLVGSYSVFITATNEIGADSTEVFATAIEPADTEDPPTLQNAPTISGSGEVGEALSCTEGTWQGLPEPTITFQWQKGGVNIAGATASTYVPVDQDNSATIRCVVTATNTAGSVSATTNEIVIETYTVPANTVLPAVTGSASVGGTLTCSTGTWTGNPTPTFTFQWLRNGSAITGATSSSYVAQAADEGETVSCQVTGTNFLSAAAAVSNGVVVASSTDDWILEEGVWDDDGEWDDTAQWKDTIGGLGAMIIGLSFVIG